MKSLEEFRDSLSQPDPIAAIREGLVGDGDTFETPFGTHELIYADYVASGRALWQIEDYVLKEILPVYANSHTEASHCGAAMTRLRDAARRTIAGLVGADADCHVVFAGSGATAGINRIVGLLQVAERVARGGRVRILIGSYEHHSNILPWRETGAEVVEIAASDATGIDLRHLEEALADVADHDLVVGAFSAASNVTGILTDTEAVTRVLKSRGALAIWDYACAAPYVDMRMTPSGEAAKDAIVFSPHKFPGGPGASGIAVVRDTVVRRATPTAPGGGTVSFVSPWRHAYSDAVETREEGGTPNVIGDIRAALVMLVKDAIGTQAILARDEELRTRALACWLKIPSLRILGQRPNRKALPIFSFQVFDHDGTQVHQNLVTRILSDVTGIQARGGCACAGPYAHRLLDIDRAASESLFARLLRGEELSKPGWTRLNLSYLHSDAQVRFIIDAVARLGALVGEYGGYYTADPHTARFTAHRGVPSDPVARID